MALWKRKGRGKNSWTSSPINSPWILKRSGETAKEEGGGERGTKLILSKEKGKLVNWLRLNSCSIPDHSVKVDLLLDQLTRQFPMRVPTAPPAVEGPRQGLWQSSNQTSLINCMPASSVGLSWPSVFQAWKRRCLCCWKPTSTCRQCQEWAQRGRSDGKRWWQQQLWQQFCDQQWWWGREGGWCEEGEGGGGAATAGEED